MFPYENEEYPFQNNDELVSRYFPGCCGIRILAEFGWTKDAGHASAGLKPSLDRIEKLIKKNIFEMRNEASWEASSLLSTMNDEQLKKLWPLMRKMGFEKLKRFYHPAHKNYITILFKPIYENKREANQAAKNAEDDY